MCYLALHCCGWGSSPLLSLYITFAESISIEWIPNYISWSDCHILHTSIGEYPETHVVWIIHIYFIHSDMILKIPPNPLARQPCIYVHTHYSCFIYIPHEEFPRPIGLCFPLHLNTVWGWLWWAWNNKIYILHWWQGGAWSQFLQHKGWYGSRNHDCTNIIHHTHRAWFSLTVISSNTVEFT